MFQDLKKAHDKVEEDLVVISSGSSKKVVISESVWKEYNREFNICFVEPEDDEDHQLWVENDDVF